MSHLHSTDGLKEKQKKPRHRHSPAQLAALNELYEQNEHPSLDLRSSLAEKLGMEPKTVNAWFQNKRASSKRRARGVSYEQAPINAAVQSTSSSSRRRPPQLSDLCDDEYSPVDIHLTLRSTSIASPELSLTAFPTGNPGNFTDSDFIRRRLHSRTTAEQSEELRNPYSLNPHQTTDQRQFLADRGMGYHGIPGSFQNTGRSAVRNQKDDDIPEDLNTIEASTKDPREAQWFSPAFPPAANHPSLGPVSHLGSSHAPVPRIHRSLSPSVDGRMSRRLSSHHNTSPYSPLTSSFSRPRRSRPEPYQLDRLKQLLMKTATPSIEERSTIALELGMEVGKVTNWFRNLRQTARRRRKRVRSGDDDEWDGAYQRIDSASASRSGTPSFRSSSSSSSMDLDIDEDDTNAIQSDMGSEDEFQEAVTPPPEPVQSAPATSTPASSSSSRISINQLTLSMDSASYAELEKVSATQYSGVKIEDALLLLSFHHHVMH